MRPFNLLPDLRQRQRERRCRSLPKIVAAALGIWLLSLGCLYGGICWQLRQLEARRDMVEAEIEELKPLAQQVTRLQKLHQEIDDLERLLDHNLQRVVTAPLDLVMELLPLEISIDQMSFDSGQFSLACFSSALPPIGQLYSSLQQTPEFEQVWLGTIHNSGTDSYSFTLTLQLQGVAVYE